MPGSLVDQVETIGGALIMLVLVSVVIGAAVNTVGFTNDTETFDPAAAGESVTIGGQTIPETVAVELTTEYALAFDGAGSVQYDLNHTSLNRTASVCAVPRLGTGAADNGTFDVVAGAKNATLFTVRYHNETWQAFVENDTAHDGLTNVSAPSPRTFTPVCATYNGTHVLIEAAGNQSVDRLDSTTDAREHAVNWVGTIDEVRWTNRSLNASQRDRALTEPVYPLPSANRTLRLMFDEGSGGSTAAFFAPDSSVDTDGTDWTAGLAAPGLARGSDYELRGGPFRLFTVPGGNLAGAPIVYVTASGTFLSAWNAIVSFGALGLLFLGLGVIALGARGVLDIIEGAPR